MNRSHPQLALDESLSQEVSRAVVAAMRNTFNADVVVGKFEVGDGPVSLTGDLSGVIGMVQDDLEGTLTLSFNEETMLRILPEVLGKDVKITRDMALDAVSEITNMIFGHIKRELNAKGHELKLAIPSVLSGRGQFISHFHRGPYMIVPFALNGQDFQVHIAVHRLFAEKTGAAH